MRDIVNVIFNEKDFDLIITYMEMARIESVQDAIINAIKIAMGDKT